MLTKQNVNLNFVQGLDTKTDEKQVPFGRFLSLKNSIFTKAGLLKKRNGFKDLTALPNNSYTYTTTFNGNLEAIGTQLSAYSEASNTWVPRGHIQQVALDTLPLIRNNLNQSQCDAAVSANGLVCTVYTETGGPITPQYKYAVADATTGQNIVQPTVIVPPTGTVAGSPRSFVLGNYFIIVFTNLIGGTYHLKYFSIAVNNPTLVGPVVDITSQYSPSSSVAWDGFVANNTLYLVWNGSDGGGAIRMRYLTKTLSLSATIAFAGHVATILSITADETQSTPVIWVSFYDSGGNTAYVFAVNPILVTILAPQLILTTGQPRASITSAAQNGSVTVYLETVNAYSYDSSIPTGYIQYVSCTQGGVLSTLNTLIRSVGLASKATIVNGTMYVMVAYQSPYQSTYFLIDGSANIIAKVAYSNGAGYVSTGLPDLSVFGTKVSVPYLIKDTVIPTNKTQNAPNGGLPVYSQTGINLVTFDITTGGVVTAEIGNDLNLSGGFLWMYDGYTICEQNFHVWPDSIEAQWAASGGNMAAHPGGISTAPQYFYVATYEWSDNQGNIFRSAPSIPLGVTTSGSGTAGSVAVEVPTLRLTAKTANPVKIVLYRWSVAQPTYYQVSSQSNPTLNDPTIDAVQILDTNADSAIIGNQILYTTGGVVENIGPPATSAMALYKSRLMLVDAEDKNLIWYSKQVIENTPIEMSDLSTIYVAPTTGAQGNTGPITALSAMDDKLIIFKKDAIYYLTGNGPDNTGANNDFSDPIFITSTVGCAYPNSIVFMPNGLMFQSDKGIWLLGRDLSTNYVGAPVEKFNASTVLSALTVPATNQVRFTLDTGEVLMYDYYYGQWGEFTGVSGISSTLYQGLHTFINSFGQVLQESPGSYLDGSNPVLLSFVTSWLNLTGLQGYQRAYFFYLLGTYFTPIMLNLEIAYDYNDSSTQSTLVKPGNFSPAYGAVGPYGVPGPYGGSGNVLKERIFLSKQRCTAFQITLTEVYDPSFGIIAGQGFDLSGLNLVFAQKKGFYPISNANSSGRT